MTTIADWLAEHGLDKYTEVFLDNEIDFDVLDQLTIDELAELGIPLGARKRLLNAIATLGPPVPGLDERQPRVQKPEMPRSEAQPPDLTAPPERHRGAVATRSADRRQLTVMFCDLVGSTALSERMDPELYRDLLAAYQSAATAAIESMGGYIARYLGDGLLVYFGYPVADENAPERAIRAGLDVVAAVHRVAAREPLAVRIGIATGPVVVGDIVGEGAAQEATVLGETPNLAARLQQAASPDTVLFSTGTHALLGEIVEAERLAPLELKGLSEPVTSYRAIGVRNRSELAEPAAEDAPMVGRDVELALLERAWHTATGGEGQAVVILGEAGVGKSRLLRALQNKLEDVEHTRILHFCSPYHTATANYPAVEHLRRTLPVDAADPVASRARLATLLQQLRLDVAYHAPALAALLSIPAGDEDRATTMEPARMKRQAIAAQLALLLATARQQPVLFIVEDLHWADPTTLEVLETFVDTIRTARVLLVMTARQEFRVPWADSRNHLTVSLTRLSRHDTLSWVRSIVSRHGLSDVAVEHIVERTDGIPLYVEELTRDMIESPARDTVPASLHDSLIARLDRVGDARELAQMGAVIGRTFSLDALHPMTQQHPDALHTQIQQLLDTGLVHRRRGREEHLFEFKHALVRDAAYESLLHSRRRTLHRQVAAAMEDATESSSDEHVQLLAHHHEHGGNAERAFELWTRAGRDAVGRAHYAEAVRSYRHALTVLESQSSSLARDDAELDVRIALIAPLVASEGFAAEPVGNNAARALELCERVDEDERLYLASYAHWVNLRVGGKTDQLLPISDALRPRADANSPAHAALIGRMEGQALFDIGRFHDGLASIERAIVLLDQDGAGDLQYGTEPLIQCRFYRALLSWLTGKPDVAFAEGTAVVETAEELGHANTLAVCLGHIGFMLYALAEDKERMASSMQRLGELADDKGLAQWQSTSLYALGMLLDTPEARAAQMQTALAEFMRIGVRAWYPVMAGWLAREQLTFDIDLAARTLASAMQEAHRHGQAWSNPELLRVEAAILQRSGRGDEADARLVQAQTLAHVTDNSCWELRCLLDRARLRPDSPLTPEVRLSINQCVERFSPGFDSSDLRAAATLLAAPE